MWQGSGPGDRAKEGKSVVGVAYIRMIGMMSIYCPLSYACLYDPLSLNSHSVIYGRGWYVTRYLCDDMC